MPRLNTVGAIPTTRGRLPSAAQPSVTPTLEPPASAPPIYDPSASASTLHPKKLLLEEGNIHQLVSLRSKNKFHLPHLLLHLKFNLIIAFLGPTLKVNLVLQHFFKLCLLKLENVSSNLMSDLLPSNISRLS